MEYIGIVYFGSENAKPSYTASYRPMPASFSARFDAMFIDSQAPLEKPVAYTLVASIA